MTEEQMINLDEIIQQNDLRVLAEYLYINHLEAYTSLSEHLKGLEVVEAFRDIEHPLQGFICFDNDTEIIL